MMIRNIFIAIVSLILVSLSVFLIQMYPFAKGVAKDAKDKTYDYNSTFTIQQEELKKYEDYEKLKIVDLDKNLKKTLNTDTKDDIVYLDIYVSGEIIGKGKLRLYHPPYENFSEILIEGKIDEEYRTDWYGSDILIEYIPVGTVKGGSVLLRYKFLTF